jgi:radical SAM protein with 4Fe4S-binding SPASM domain
MDLGWKYNSPQKKFLMDKDKLLNESKVFCMAPWVSVHAWPNGNMYPCCLWKSNEPIGNLNNENFEDILNNDIMKETRLKMLNGEKVSQCDRCYVVETETIYGYRKRLNSNFADSFDIVETTQEDGGIKEMKLKLWDIRISNFCNFKCRSCGHELSSSWYNDSIGMGRNMEGVKPVISIDDKNNFMETLLPHFEYVEEIYFAGGEPLIMPEHYEILDKLIEMGKTDVRIRYSTNFSKLIYKGKHIFEYWKQFPNLELFISVDGVNEIGEYVRKGFNTELFKNNITDFFNQDIQYFNYGYIVTYSILNYIHLFDLILYLFENDLLNKELTNQKQTRIEFSPVTEPSYYSVTILPENYKDDFKNKLNNFGEVLDQRGVSIEIKTDILNKLESVYSFSKSGDYNDKEFNNFLSVTKKLDSLRNENYKVII